MRMKIVIGVSIVLLLSTLTSALSVKSEDRKSKTKSEEKTKLDRQVRLQSDYDNDDQHDHVFDSTLDSRELVKKVQNVSEVKSVEGKKKKEHSPPGVDVIPPAELRTEDSSDEDGQRLAKADVNKNPRIYYDDTAPKYPHSHISHPHHSPEEEVIQKDGKIYFPKNYINSKFAQGSKKGHRQYAPGLSGKRIPDHVQFDEGAGGHPPHEYTVGHGHSHQHAILGHQHEEHEIGGPVDDTPYSHHHGSEEHYGKGHHHQVPDHGYHHHYGSYRHTIGDKVDAVGRALQVLLPSALLFTGVSALFPNRVHVPTNPTKYRQKRSVFRRRVSNRGMVPSPPLEPLPSAHIPPEFEDIPSHILRAEHRIMDGNPAEMYPEYGRRYGTSSDESPGFDPFKVFKGPGPETTMTKMIQNAVLFPGLPAMSESNEKGNDEYSFQGVHIDGGSEENLQPPAGVQINAINSPPRFNSNRENSPPLSVEVEVHTHSPPQRIVPQISPITTNLDAGIGTDNGFSQQRQNIPLRLRKTTRKPPIFLKETPKLGVQQSSESQKSQYLVKTTHQEKAEQEFMSSLQNLVTPDVAKAIVESKQEPPKEIDLSPDGPVMGLLTSYAQHENDTPSCQKRALCELAVKGKNPKSTKFEGFLWSVATLVPDVFSEMYDLQEVFQAIRNERCNRFTCINPNLDLQV